MEASPGSAGRIFICYRRGDAGYPAGWLFDELVQRFGAGRVFKDVDSIEPGDDFAEVISAAVGSCAVLLAVIGRGWLEAAGEDGTRLDDPADFVRLEIEAALERGVRVIPVLVDGARMPRREQLPASLGQLAARQALGLSHARFRADLGPLLRVLDKTFASPAAEPGTRPLPSRADAAGPAPVPQAQRTDPDTAVAAVLARLDTYGSPLVCQAYDGLAELGYVMRASVPRDPARPPQSYLRIHDPNRPGAAIGYLTPQNISFTLDRAQLGDEPGGHIVPSTGEVAFPHADPASLARGLQVARKLKRNLAPVGSVTASSNTTSRYTNCVVCGWPFTQPGGQARPTCQALGACARRVSAGWLPGIGDPRNPHNLGAVTVGQARASQAAALASGMLPPEYIASLHILAPAEVTQPSDRTPPGQPST